jgi:tetratricopeptide (TPR) repeat protein
LRLSEAQSWRHEHSAALATLEAGLRQRDRLAVRWVNLLEARRHYALGQADSAVEAFQGAVLDDRDDIDAWLGLGESLFHLATYSGHSPLEARGALERTVELDSAFYPIYDHLVDIALYQGDATRARKYVRRMPPEDPATLAREEAIVLRFERGAARDEALRRLRDLDRQTLSRLVVLWTHGAANLPLADTIASYLTQSGRTPDDRRRGAQFRLVALAGQGRWDEALAVWQREGADQPFDGWMVHAYMAGYRAEAVAGPMIEWARSQVRRGIIPDFTLPAWDESQQAFQALAHQATLTGDSSEVMDLLKRMKTANRATDLSDPTAASLEASLRARLALLADDSASAVAALRRSLARIYHPFTWYYPLTSMAPQRRLLGELLQARGTAVEAKRWHDSFHRSWSIGDVLFINKENHHVSR